MRANEEHGLEPTNTKRKRVVLLASVPAAIALTLAVAFSLTGLAGASTARIAVAPSNTVLPTISGTATVGQMLTAATGTWSGTTPITYTYAW